MKSRHLYLMRLLMIILLLFPCYSSFAQFANQDNFLSVREKQPVIFNYLTPDELLHDKTLDNALEITVDSKTSDCSISASIIFNDPNSSRTLDNRIALVFNSKTSPDAALASTEVPLSSIPRLLFTQPRMQGNIPDYSYNYDIVLHPTATMAPVNSNYSIIFTMTQPMRLYSLYILAITLATAIPHISVGQHGYNGHGNNNDHSFKQTISGSVSIPALQSMNVIYPNQDEVRFDAQSVNQSKVYTHYCEVVVKSNIPWDVSVAANDANIRSNDKNLSLPISMIHIKNATDNIYMPLSIEPQVIAQSKTDSIQSIFYVDLKLDPPGFKYPGGSYNISLNFTLSPQ